MTRYRSLKMLPVTALGVITSSILSLPIYAGTAETGEKGASVYCYLRNSGNSHSVSWDGAYQIVKRQKSSLFKTSPKHAAVMITETVVQNPEKYNCGQYLGDLFAAPGETTLVSDPENEDLTIETDEIPSEIKKGDRYSY